VTALRRGCKTPHAFLRHAEAIGMDPVLRFVEALESAISSQEAPPYNHAAATLHEFFSSVYAQHKFLAYPNDNVSLL
jgi:hypothetical protein